MTEAATKTILISAACITFFATPVLHAQREPAASRYGLNAQLNLAPLSGPLADKTREVGADVIRIPVGWDVIESCKGCFDWSATDRWRDEARRTGRTVFASVGYTPRWANGGRPYNYPPLNLQDWYDFVFAAVSRYRDDVMLWGIWNEPNLDLYLDGGDLRTYQSLVRTAAAAIHAANPRASVLGPEVSHHGVKDGWFAAAMALFGDAFDIVTVHWFPDGPDLPGFMDDLVRPNSLRKDVWLSEVGSKPCATVYGEAGQALFYQQVLNTFAARRHWWTAVLFYDLYDPPVPLDCGSGIVRPDWSNRPAFTLLQAFIRANP